VDGRTDSSNDNVFESVESEQGILLQNIEKKQLFLELSKLSFIQWEISLLVTLSDFLDKQNDFESDNEFMQLVSVKFFYLFFSLNL